MKSNVAPRWSFGWLMLFCLALGCRDGDAKQTSTFAISQVLGTDSTNYCELPEFSDTLLMIRPVDEEAPIDDVNWFARPVPHDGDDLIVAFASHDQNYLYNLTEGVRVRIPDRSDAVATPDGRYITVPSFYTPDSHIRFYSLRVMLERLERGDDATDVEPVFIHDHPAMQRVYYQSTAVLSEDTTEAGIVTIYRLMFSGTADESQFRIVDYRFTRRGGTDEVLNVVSSPPMRTCPEVKNDLNTPFISKDGRYVAAYTSEREGAAYSDGASLKIFEITSTNPAAGTTSCREVVDFGFAAGKADFSFDGHMLTFHISQGAYLTPFINGGLPSGTITDVVVAQLTLDERGDIVGHGGLRRLTTSVQAGVGSYFPAFFPDGSLFYIANAVPKESDESKRFELRVMDPSLGPWQTGTFDSDQMEMWTLLSRHWEGACSAELPPLGEAPFGFKPHEAPWLALSLNAGQCQQLVADARAASDTQGTTDWESITRFCTRLRE